MDTYRLGFGPDRSTRPAMTGRPGGINVSLWLAVGLVLPAVYGLALLLAAFLDTWNT